MPLPEIDVQQWAHGLGIYQTRPHARQTICLASSARANLSGSGFSLSPSRS